MVKLSGTLAHIRDLRATLNNGKPVNVESGLSSDDLTVVIETIEAIDADLVAHGPE